MNIKVAAFTVSEKSSDKNIFTSSVECSVDPDQMVSSEQADLDLQ